MQKLFYIIILAGLVCHSHAAANTTGALKKHLISASLDTPPSQQNIDYAFTAPDALLTIMDDNDKDEQDVKTALLSGTGLFQVQHNAFSQPGDKRPLLKRFYHKGCRLSILYSVFRL